MITSKAIRMLGWLLLLGAAGCASRTSIVVGPTVPLMDLSVPAPQKPGYATIMVLPPVGSDRGAVNEQLSSLEKAMLKHRVRVISSGVTGRVVLDSIEARKTESAQHLTDLERALVLAKKSNADAILQIIRVEWTDFSDLHRYFWLENGRFSELEKKPDSDWFRNTKGIERRLWVAKGRTFNFEAKLIDVESGEIVTAVDLAHSTARETDGKQIFVETRGNAVTTEGDHTTVIDTPELRMAVVNRVMDRLADQIVSGPVKVHAPPGPSAEELALIADRKELEKERQRVEEEKKKLAAEAEQRRASEEAQRAAEAELAASRDPKRDQKKK